MEAKLSYNHRLYTPYGCETPTHVNRFIMECQCLCWLCASNIFIHECQTLLNQSGLQYAAQILGWIFKHIMVNVIGSSLLGNFCDMGKYQYTGITF